MLVGHGVIVGVIGVDVGEGRGVRVRVSVGDIYGDGEERGVLVGGGVADGQGVKVGIGVTDGLGVFVGVVVKVGDLEGVWVRLGTAVGGSPSIVN